MIENLNSVGVVHLAFTGRVALFAIVPGIGAKVMTNILKKLHFLRNVQWSSLHVLALLIITLGLYGVISFFIGVVHTNPFVGALIANPVFWNDQRLTPEKALEQLTKDFPGNFATVIGFSVFIILLSIHYASVLRGLYAYAPVRSIIAAVFLGGSVLFGLLVGLSSSSLKNMCPDRPALRREVTWPPVCPGCHAARANSRKRRNRSGRRG